MYVKIIDGERRRAAIVYEADGSHPLDFGRVRVEADPSEMDWDELTEALGVAGDSMDRTQVREEATARKPNGDWYWEVGWVRFRKPGFDAVHLVASTGPIYILGDNGKTVDRV